MFCVKVRKKELGRRRRRRRLWREGWRIRHLIRNQFSPGPDHTNSPEKKMNGILNGFIRV
jgi:hypothetical protein